MAIEIQVTDDLITLVKGKPIVKLPEGYVLMGYSLREGNLTVMLEKKENIKFSIKEFHDERKINYLRTTFHTKGIEMVEGDEYNYEDAVLFGFVRNSSVLGITLASQAHVHFSIESMGKRVERENYEVALTSMFS